MVLQWRPGFLGYLFGFPSSFENRDHVTVSPSYVNRKDVPSTFPPESPDRRAFSLLPTHFRNIAAFGEEMACFFSRGTNSLSTLEVLTAARAVTTSNVPELLFAQGFSAGMETLHVF